MLLTDTLQTFLIFRQIAPPQDLAPFIPLNGMRLPRLHRTRSSTAHDKAGFIIPDFHAFVNGKPKSFYFSAIICKKV